MPINISNFNDWTPSLKIEQSIHFIFHLILYNQTFKYSSFSFKDYPAKLIFLNLNKLVLVYNLTEKSLIGCRKISSNNWRKTGEKYINVYFTFVTGKWRRYFYYKDVS